MIPMLDTSSSIGVFDSGIGGLSVLRALCAALPKEQFIYFADTANAPYGEKGDAFVRQRSIAITQRLRAEHGIKALVVACNTATAAAITELRALHPDLIIIGIEPALKPAANHSVNKRVTVFATQGTLASAKFQRLLAQQSEFAQFTCVACDGLAETIERRSNDLNHLEIANLLGQYIAASNVHIDAACAADTVVLGCTHYPLVKHVFSALLPPQTHIIDNGAAVAKRLQEQLDTQALLCAAQTPQRRAAAVQFSSSADSRPLATLWVRLH
jgi:glutamate racemase